VSDRDGLLTFEGVSDVFYCLPVQRVCEKWYQTLQASYIVTAFMVLCNTPAMKARSLKERMAAGYHFLEFYSKHPLFSAELLLAIEKCSAQRVQDLKAKRKPERVAEILASAVDSTFHEEQKISGSFLKHKEISSFVTNLTGVTITEPTIRQHFSAVNRRRAAIVKKWTARMDAEVSRHKKPRKK
jgi:hypothetical protein